MKYLLFLSAFFGLTLAYSQNPFITTWKTDNPGVSEDNQITIPTYKAPDFLPQVMYDYNVDWGDGSISENVTGDVTHTYATPGVYQVSISGIFPRIFFEDYTNSKDVGKLIEINQWGSNQWNSMAAAFTGCENLDVKATDIPNFSGLTDISRMFENCGSLIGNDTMANWNVSTVSQMYLLFAGAIQFNQPLGSWNVSQVENMYGVFNGASSFNQNIGSWDVSNVTDMSLMFSSTQEFDQDISGWEVNSVKWMQGMFFQAIKFNNDLSSWSVASVENMSSMFSSASSFNQNLGAWNIGNVNDMTSMLSNTSLSTENYDSTLTGWSNLSFLKKGVILDSSGQYCEGGIGRQTLIKVNNWTINDGGLLPGCTASQQRPFITTWQIEESTPSTDYNITIPTYPGETYDYSIDWGDGTTDSNITTDITHQYDNPGIYTVSISGDFPRIYFDAGGENSALIINVNQWGDISWNSMERAFSNCINLDVTALDVPNLSGVTSANQMFHNCLALTGNPSFNNWDVSSLQDADEMFSGSPLFNQSLSSWETSNLTSMYRMFYNSGFDNSLGTWDVSNVNSLTEIFEGSPLTTVNYDNTLIGWGHLNSLQPNVVFDAGTSQFCNAVSARQSIIEDFNWTINDSGENCPSFQPFVTTWKTDNLGMSDNNTISLPTYGGPFDIDWGDGNNETEVYGEVQHTYIDPGVYTVRISGNLNAILFQSWKGNEANSDATKLIEINQWGDIQWASMSSAFGGCANLDVVAGDTPDLSNLTSLFSMFIGCESLTDNPTFNEWDVSSIDNLTQVFSNCTAFNADISNWDVSNVTGMQNLFNNCPEFNQDISNWDVGNVTDMGSMFNGATQFDQPIGNWDVSNVTNMAAMFNQTAFNQDITNWDVGNVQSMNFMFNFTPNFNQDISSWNVSNVTDMSNMFSSTSSFNQPIGNWDVSNVTNMKSMFANAWVFNQDISNWNVSNVTNMYWLFVRAYNFDQNLANWDISQVTDMSEIFNFSGLSNANYNNILIGWSQLPSLQRAVTFDALQNQYCESEDARQFILDNFNWVINDGGKIPFCNEDNDFDGVLDHRDACLNTLPEVTVDENGCEIIPQDAILVYGLTPTCPGESNGSIQVSSTLTNHSFSINLDGPTPVINENISLEEPFTIDNLSAGMYTIEISIPQVSYSKTYGIQMNEVGSISGKRENLDLKSKSVSYSVKGSHSYKVNINGKDTLFSFDSTDLNQIHLNNLDGFNTISISGESDCQGLIEDSFNFSDSVVMYPVYTTDKTFIEGYDEKSEVQIFDISGRLLFQKILQKDNLESIDLKSYDSGIYPVKIISNKNTQTFKIIKQ